MARCGLNPLPINLELFIFDFVYMFRAIRCLMTFLAGFLCAATGFCVDPSVNWVIGVLDSSMPKMQWVIRDSFHKIDPIYTDRRLVVRQLPAEAIYEAVRNQSLDFVCASPQVISILERYYGYELLASLYQKKEGGKDNKQFFSETSALVFTKKGSNSWEQLQGKEIALIEHDIPDTELLLLEELKQKGFDKDKAWRYVRYPVLEDAVRTLKNGSVQALAISSCLYREVNANIFADFDLIPPDVSDGAKGSLTPHSTSLFPGWAFASSIRVNRKTGEEFAQALRAFDFSSTVTWDTARDYTKVHRAQEELGFEPYLKFQRISALEFIREHILWFFAAMALVLGLILRVLLKERTVRRLTVELMHAMQKERASEKRFEELEHIASVSQISSIVAHELRQPLAAVTNFAMGIRRRANNNTLTPDSLDFALGRILQENERASAIVDHVRNYAKKHEKQSEEIQLSTLMSKAGLGLEVKGDKRIEFHVEGNPKFRADALEMGLVIRNLVKNAVEAIGENPDGRILVDLRIVERHIVFTVSDNGPITSEADVEKLSVPMRSEKNDGLGLGLSIARKIVESYDGTIEFARNIPHGLKVTVKFPLKKE